MTPISYIQLGDNELQLYGPTSIFRLAPRTPERLAFNEGSANGIADAYRAISQDNPPLNAELDWARHLPQGVPLTRSEHDRYVRFLPPLVAASALQTGLVPGLGCWSSYFASSLHGGSASSQNCSSVTCTAACPCRIYHRPSKRRTTLPCSTMPFWLSPRPSQMTQGSKTPLPVDCLSTRPSPSLKASANSPS
jgi:hypothetical protein